MHNAHQELIHEKIPKIMFYFENTNGNVKKPTLVHQLNLKLDGGILRSYGRIKNSEIPNATKYPILLDSKSELTRLIVLNAHHDTMHSGTNY